MSTACRIFVIFVFALIGAAATVSVGRERSGIVEENSGTTSELAKIKFDGLQGRFNAGTRKMIFVLNEPFQIAINLDELVSIKAKDANAERPQEFEICYVQTGKKKSIAGPLSIGVFTGESKNGKIEFSTKGFKELIFTDAPGIALANFNKTREDELKANKSTLFLYDGTEVFVRGLRRVATFYSTVGFAQGGTTLNLQYPHIQFAPRKPLEAIDFSKLKSIEFTDKDSLTILFQSGESETHMISKENDARIDGFSGVNDDGDFYIAARFVKRIELAHPPPKKKPAKAR